MRQAFMAFSADWTGNACRSRGWQCTPRVDDLRDFTHLPRIRRGPYSRQCRSKPAALPTATLGSCTASTAWHGLEVLGWWELCLARERRASVHEFVHVGILRSRLVLP